MGVHPGLRPQLVAKQLESPDCSQSTIDGQTTAPTLLITVVVDNAFRARSVVQWHGFRQSPPTGTSPADGIEGVTSTYYYYVADRARYDRDGAAKFTNGQGGEAGPTAASRVCTDKERSVRRRHAVLSSGRRADTAARHGAVSVPREDEGWTAGGCHVHPLGQGPYACPEAQLMANCPVIHLNDEGKVERLLRWSAATLEAAGSWVTGICGGRDHVVYACPESQLMADNPVIYLNGEGPVEWLLR